MNYKILHVSTHYGGGVGSVISAWTNADKNNLHTLTYLNDVPENKNQNTQLFNVHLIPDYDFILCHVWNHPALFEFLVKTKLPPCRLIGWSHMSGLYPPYILFDKLINYFDEFLYTSPISNACGIKKDFIWSSGNIDKFLEVKKKTHIGFNIGYIGTLDFAKLHPNFIDICKQIADSISDTTFIIVGSGCDFTKIQNQTIKYGIRDKFIFIGQVQDIIPYLERMDVFLYPLTKTHFGTCEQVLGEAMAAGIPCVVLDNAAEKYIFSYRDTEGIICQDTKEIVSAICDIKENGYYDRLELMIKSMQLRAQQLYSMENKIKQWNNVFDKIYFVNKNSKAWRINQ